MNDELEMQGAPGMEGGEDGQFSQQPPEAPPAPQNVALSPESIEQLVKQLQVAPTTPVTPAQQPRQLSQEEINKAMAVFNADKRYVERLGLRFEQPEQYEEAVAALNEMLDGKTRQAVTMSSWVVENLKRQIQSELEPLRQFVSQAREQQLRQEFFKGNEDLKQFEPLVEAVYTRLTNAGKTFASKEEAFKVVAEQARQLLAKIQPGQGGDGGGTATTAPRRMPTVTTGGRGGASGAASGRTPDPVAKALFS